MQFFITLGLLVAAATAYLLYQYRSRALAASDAADQVASSDETGGTLKAA
ncbi:MAG TPA: hypothetical protein VEZ14_00810 [Dehalococcoidia bacterium]|nr:hypothetical protein [Dehalococcoidia bacterium]